MDQRKKWIINKINWGWIWLAAGIFCGAAGVILGRVYANLPYNFGILTGLGILLAGIGINAVITYRIALSNQQVAARLAVAERDERTVLIRSRAGNRAYWVSAALIYAGLIWESFAANGKLPALLGDALWYFLAAAVLAPFGVYAGSILIDEHQS